MRAAITILKERMLTPRIDSHGTRHTGSSFGAAPLLAPTSPACNSEAVRKEHCRQTKKRAWDEEKTRKQVLTIAIIRMIHRL